MSEQPKRQHSWGTPEEPAPKMRKADQYNVNVPEFMDTPTKGTNLDGPRREYYTRDAAMEGRPATKVTKTRRGTSVLGSTLNADPSQVEIDVKSHELLGINPDITRAHEGSHQDALYAGRKDALPVSQFIKDPVTAQTPMWKSVLNEMGFLHNTSKPDLVVADASMARGAKALAKKHHTGRNTTELLADLKALEASLPRGGDIEQTQVWKDLVKESGVPAQALKQWFLYNHVPGFGAKGIK